MASISFKKRDLNRFLRVYPYARYPVREETVPEGNFQVESGILTFVNESGPKIYNFTAGFTTTPAISGISVQTSTNANVNVFISAISSISVSFEVSAPFTGQVSFIAMQVA